MVDGHYGEWIRAELNMGGFKQMKRVEKMPLQEGGEKDTHSREGRIEEDRCVTVIRTNSQIEGREVQRVDNMVLQTGKDKMSSEVNTVSGSGENNIRGVE